MVVSSLFSKLKTLTPVGVVGLAVVVTIKLLTTTTPTNEATINVDAIEDIKTEDYKDEIQEPEVPPPPVEEEQPQPESQETEQGESKEETEEGEGESVKEDEEEKEEEKEMEEKQDPPKTAGRTWRNNGDPLVGMLQRLLSNKKQ